MPSSGHFYIIGKYGIITDVDNKTIRNISLKGKRVLYRVAYDVPLTKKGGQYVVQDDTRIQASIPTLQYLLKNNCRIVILTWLGRPGGRRQKKYQLDPVAKRLSRLIKKPVVKLNDCVGTRVKKRVLNMKPGEVILLENVRFHKEEDKKDVRFMKQLAELGEIQIFDAFAQAHRDVASIMGPQRYLPTVPGFILEKEISHLGQLIKKPKRLFVAVIGGAKIEDKVALLEQLLKKADSVLMGGVSANALLQARGHFVGKSKIDSQAIRVTKRIKLRSPKLILPIDFVTAQGIGKKYPTQVKAIDDIEANDYLFDIGPRSIKQYSSIIKKARTVLWSGPLGYFEMPQFSQGTYQVARAIARTKGQTIAGGGDTEAALELSGVEKKIDFVSTGGGAMLEYLSGKKLVGLKFLNNK